MHCCVFTASTAAAISAQQEVAKTEADDGEDEEELMQAEKEDKTQDAGWRFSFFLILSLVLNLV